MGQNRRYQRSLDAISDLRTAQRTLEDEGGPVSLGPEQLARDEHPTTTFPEAVQPKVWAWVVTERGTWLELPGVVVAETPYAAAIRITFPPARVAEYRCWVWQGACRARKGEINWGPASGT